MVWTDGDVELDTCPILLLTPDVTEIRRWFHATHRLTALAGGAVVWERFALPADGGAGQQDARLMAALDWWLDCFNRHGLKVQQRRDPAAELTAYAERRSRNRE